MSAEAATFSHAEPRRGVLASWIDMSAQRSVGGDVDASRLKFSLRLFIQVVCAFLGGLAAMYTSTAGMRSDLRDMRTMMTMEAEVDKIRQTLLDERAARLISDMNAIKGQMLTTNYDIQGLKTDVAILKAQGAKK